MAHHPTCKKRFLPKYEVFRIQLWSITYYDCDDKSDTFGQKMVLAEI